ncbi:MAG: hypothetical protein V1913_08270 [Fibrobacterota bacterium]
MNRLSALLICLCLFLTSCGTGPDIAGSGSESPNALTGTVLWQPGLNGPASLAVGASVVLYQIKDSIPAPGSIDYIWSQAAITVADNNGNFRFPAMTSGHYSLILEFNGQKRFSGYFNYRANDSLVHLGYLQLFATQNIRGTIRDTVRSVPSRLVLGLVGTPYHDTVETDGAFAFSSVPVGNYYFSIKSLPIMTGIGMQDSIVGATSVLVCDTLRPIMSFIVTSSADLAVIYGGRGTAPLSGSTVVNTSVRAFDTVSTTVNSFKIIYALENNTDP